jgi:hypothetical protein
MDRLQMHARDMQLAPPFSSANIHRLLRKIPTNALYMLTQLYAVLHCYMFQPSSGHPQGLLVHVVSRANTILVQL